jgi:predicted aspartyl protease
MGLSLVGTGAAAEDCTLGRVSSIDMKIDTAGGMNLPMILQGKQIDMLVDTGGIYSMLRSDVVSTLGLQEEPIDTFRYRMTMMGGKIIKYFTHAHDVTLGTMHAADLSFVVMPDGVPISGDVGGTIAPDILSNFDVDLDMANAKINLFSQKHCPGRVIYWTNGPVAIVPINKNEYGQFDIDITLDGKSLKADIDTGSSRSFMSYEDAKDLFDWKDNEPSVTAEAGAYRHHFTSLSFKGIAVNNPDIILFPYKNMRLETDGKLILGMGILRQLHVYIAYHERNLYLTAADAH